MRPVRIIRGLGGNGSTFISRVIAAMEKVVLLSETNPLSANLFAFALNPVTQIQTIYEHLRFSKYVGHVAEVGAPDLFGKYISRLLAECELMDHTLVIRDYNYVDYIGTPFVWPSPQRSSLDFALTNVPIKDILLIRHPVPQFVSLSSHAELTRALQPRAFLNGYRTMLDRHVSARIVRYEDVFAAFDERLREILDHLSLPLSPDWKTRIESLHWVSGHERGKTSVKPEPTMRPLNSEIRGVFQPLEDYQIICKTCGYEC